LYGDKIRYGLAVASLLAHVEIRNLAKLQREGHILGLTNVVFEKDRLCSACQARKQVGAPHLAKNILTSTRPLKFLHMDLFGPNCLHKHWW